MLVCAISADRAFDVLTWYSQETSVKVLMSRKGFSRGWQRTSTCPTPHETHCDHVLLGL
ncbi:hypothetical protein [Rhodococcus sp. C-2]